MKIMEFINKPIVKKVAKWAGCAVAGIMAFADAIEQHKREAELEALKKTVAELKAKES